MTSKNWNELLQKYPTIPADFQAAPEPEWDDLSWMVSGVGPKGVDRAIARYRKAQSKALHSDAQFENIAFTEPEVQTLIEGGDLAGKADSEVAQVRAMVQASNFLMDLAIEGEVQPGQAVSDDIHVFIASALQVPTVQFRGDQQLRYDGPRVSLGRGQVYAALDARLTHAALDSGLERIKQIEHPVLRGAAWAAFATYHQFYFDGNKRAGRYTMNTVLMSHGYDAILIPYSDLVEYEDVLVEAYKSGDLTSHIRFLIERYRD